MQNFHVESTTAAAAALGVDLLTVLTGVSGQPPSNLKVDPRRNRLLRRFGFTGSTAIGDAKVQLVVDGEVKGSAFISRVGAPASYNDDLADVNIAVKAGQEFSVLSVDAPATNAVFLIFQWAPMD